MTTRLPLVLGADGLAQQLQAGDNISSPTNTPSIRSVTNGESSVALTIGTPVYASAADTVKRGQANAKSTGKLAGLCYDSTIAAAAAGNICQSGVLIATTVQWDAVTSQTGGLTFNATYFLDPATLGKITTVVPVTVGQVVTVVGMAISTTELELNFAMPILL